MYEENRKFSWANLFIKVIIIIVFVLFTVWLLSLSNGELSNSLDVLTDNIFSQNVEKMKEVGKEYFTTERLPKKLGDVKTLTLSKMYDEKLILELKDKNGKACSSKNSYVSVEKMENEYQMKVYLECGKQSDYVVVIMGCYDYCETDICELKENEKENNTVEKIEYQYSKTTGGKWSNWGKWTKWSVTKVSETSSRDVETKVVEEEYSYDRLVGVQSYVGKATCPEVTGYTLVSNNSGKCNYVKQTTKIADPVCPTLSGYTLSSRNGFTCNYTANQSATSSKDPICPTVNGYTYTGRNGFTCNYSKTVNNSESEWEYVSTKTGSYIPANTDTYRYTQLSADYKYDCDNACSFKWIYTYKVEKKVTKTVSGTETTSKTASCPTGYSKSGNTCVKSSTVSVTKTANCPSGYSVLGNTCVKYSDSSLQKDVQCGTNQYIMSGKCYRTVLSTITETSTEDVTYYRYRTRKYENGTTVYKWSSSKNDKELLDAGYKLTGKTREVK